MSQLDGSETALTRRQREVLAALRRIHDQLGYAPTLRELGDEVGLSSVSSVQAQLKNLERLGLVERQAGRPRALRVAAAPAVDVSHAPSVPLREPTTRTLIGRRGLRR